MNVTRDSMIWWLGIIAAVLAYLSASESPAVWAYTDWVQAAAFVVATISGKLATSPLRGEHDAFRVDPKRNGGWD